MFHKIESTWMESISGQYTLEPGAAVSLLSAFSLPVTGLVSFPIYRYCLPQFGVLHSMLPFANAVACSWLK
ncbi:hypothetical protein F8388_007335 [Cannabis sativa]|uniref:Uncharacterized protein n=1 Tax=Cannabis sativa TaxID=3483 RepID=A0A7J6FHK7_CANSA|nr:hypothetical protein F8388_007335 [Cannabis sativa]